MSAQHDRLPSHPRLSLLPSSPARRHVFGVLSTLCLLLLLLAQFITSWPFAASTAFAARLPVVSGHLTLQQFLQESAGRRASAGTFHFPAGKSPLSLAKGEHLANYAHLPPSAEPPTMQPLHATLSTAFLSGAAGTQPLDLTGSDHRLEVTIPAGAFDLSHAAVTGAASGTQHPQPTPAPGVTPTAPPAKTPTATPSPIDSPSASPTPSSTPTVTVTPQPSPVPGSVGVSGPLTLSITELRGNFVGQVNSLGQYQFQITDQQGTVVSGILLRQPITIRYHYDPSVLAGLGLNPGTLVAGWPAQLAAQRAAHQPADAYSIPLHNDLTTHTLTGQSSVLPNGPFDAGSGVPDNQSPPSPLVASVQGNSGQLATTYPLVVAPGPPGTTPSLQMVYSSGATNQRHNRASPADNFGEGWTLSLGAITADEYPGGTTWYSLSGVDDISDLLVPNPNDQTQFLTEHISSLRIRQQTANGQPCFEVWDGGGTRYEFGCTGDSLQYYTDSNGARHNYRWDVDSIVPANEGPGTDGRFITVTYLQDAVSANGGTTIRDSAIKQITYGASASDLAGTIDFSYLAPFSDGSWATKYTGSCAPLRCDDPVNVQNGLNAPQVFTTFTPVTITNYVGSDSSSSNKDYSYSFSFNGSAYTTQCTDDYTGEQMACAGEHLLQSITPTVYQNGQGTQLPAYSVNYSGQLKDDYADTTQYVENGQTTLYFLTYWQYLARYENLASGVGAAITYQQAYSNSDGTPERSSTENRFDPLYCSTYSDCTGNYGHAQDRAWSAQVVTAITALGTDSSSSGLSAATTQYH